MSDATFDQFNSVVSQSQVLHPSLDINNAVYVDVNPGYSPEHSPAHLLKDEYAVLYGSIANLIMCPPGGRSRIFQEDYFCGLMNLLQEPFDGITANLMSMTLNTALNTWEPRLTNLAVTVDVVDNPPTYLVGVSGSLVNLAGAGFNASYSVPAQRG